MTYCRVKPHPALQPYVDSIGIQESDELSSSATIVLPTTCMNMLFHYRDRFIQHHKDGDRIEPNSYLSGQRTRPMRVSASGRTGIIVVSLYPWALPAFTRLNSSEFTDLCVPLSAIFCPWLVEEIEDRIFHSEDAQARMKVVEHFLLRVFETPDIDRRVVCAVNRINSRMGSERIRELASYLDISRRQLNRQFLPVVGLSPKKFAAINRFQKAMFFRQSGLTTEDVLNRTGYYDQAHLIHDFARYAEISPQQIFTGNVDTPLMKHFNLTGKVAHFYNTLYLQ